MRKNIIAGNWKMNTTLPEGLALAKELSEALGGKSLKCDVVVGVPFTHLAGVAAAVDAERVGVAAQNCADHVKGAFTGEVSADMIAATGARYVILGHSERRQYYHETAQKLKTKVTLALASRLTPIFCVGEVLEEREDGKHFGVVASQVEDSLFDLTTEDFEKLVIAYEPVWAIGTGKTATAEQAQEMHAHIRQTIAGKYGQAIADNTTILYGGSMNGGNAKELVAKPDVDGGLIGGASLSVEKFLPIVEAF
jgi:triosephosphate isomerase